MSNQEKVNYIEHLRNAIQSYRGFTQREKSYGLKHISDWIESSNGLEVFIKKFSELSLDVQPFLLENKLLLPHSNRREKLKPLLN